MQQSPTPSNYNLARDNSMKNRTKSVEFTYFDETGEIEEIIGYNDEDLRSQTPNGTGVYIRHATEDNMHPSQMQAQLNLGFGDDDDNDGGVYLGGQVENERPVQSDVDANNRMSTATNASDDYVIPSIPASDDAEYVAPDPLRHPDKVSYVNDPINKRYANQAFIPSETLEEEQDYVEPVEQGFGYKGRTQSEKDEDEDDYLEPTLDYNDDGYVPPNPSSKSASLRPESSDYDYADLPTTISYTNNTHSYANVKDTLKTL